MKNFWEYDRYSLACLEGMLLGHGWESDKSNYPEYYRVYKNGHMLLYVYHDMRNGDVTSLYLNDTRYWNDSRCVMTTNNTPEDKNRYLGTGISIGNAVRIVLGDMANVRAMVSNTVIEQALDAL